MSKLILEIEILISLFAALPSEIAIKRNNLKTLLPFKSETNQGLKGVLNSCAKFPILLLKYKVGKIPNTSPFSTALRND